MGYLSLGYGHPLYCQSLNEFGIPAELPRSGGNYLQRRISETGYVDGMGAYPLFTCERWNKLPEDLRSIGRKLVSFSAVLDPFGHYNESSLREYFPDVVLPFKKHFVVNFNRPLTVCSHHLRNARKAAGQLDVELSRNPSLWLQEWITLYDQLVQRHRIGDIRRFSYCSFTRQLKIPGMIALRAVHDGVTVGMLLFLVQNETVYYHLGAYSADGYRMNASSGLFSAAIDFFRTQGFSWMTLGAGAGMANTPDDGLARFKSGWSNETRIAYFCGRILNPEAYADIVRERNILPTPYFPAYRKGEFCKQQGQPVNKE
ncbi:MAG: GNAT family N-acetyltransferase [Verrucomicrobia bacterium]|nr:GNAT family N-acetyltransferase [Verrucomicrobiota bacterium]